MIDADTLALMRFDWPIDWFYFGILISVVSGGIVWLIERWVK